MTNKLTYLIPSFALLLVTISCSNCGSTKTPTTKTTTSPNNIVKGKTLGNRIPDFTQKTPEGNELSLYDLKGQYVLIEFWASWCKPCRNQNPKIVKTYRKFKDKGFTILGVSLDKKKQSWIKAIKEDTLTWHHVSDLQFWDNAIAVQFGIKSIPSNILINRDGIILAIDIEGKKLDKMLMKML